MLRNFDFRASIGVLFLLVSLGTGMANQLPLVPHGGVIWGGGNAVYEWSSATNKVTELAALREGMVIDYVDRISNTRLIFSAYNLDTPNAPANMRDFLWIYDISSKKIKRLRSGMAPTYIKNVGKLFFYDNSKKSNGLDLFVAQFNGKIVDVRRIISGSFFDPRPVIQVSKNDVVLDYDVLNKPQKILEYDMKKEVWRTLPIPDCDPVLWRAKTSQLLCTRGDSFEYYFTSLDGAHVKKLEFSEPAIFPLYSPSADAALAIRQSVSGMSESNDMWVYYFESRRWLRIARGVIVGKKSEVWINHN